MADLSKKEVDIDDFDIDFGTNDEDDAELDFDLDLDSIDLEPKVTLVKEDDNSTQPQVQTQQSTAETKQDPDIDIISLDDEGDERSTELNNYVLYIISDKVYPGMLSYFRHYGSKVTKIFNNINEAKDSLIMQIEPCKIVVIDSGTGKFTSMSARKSLMELLSISDEENRIAIFYTDSVIMSEAKNAANVEDKDITWHKYRTTAEVLAVLLQNLKKENYVYDMKDHEVVDKSEELLHFTGASFKHPEPMDLGITSIDLNEVRLRFGDNITKEYEVPGFKIKV